MITTTFLQMFKLLDRSMDLLQTWTGYRGRRGGCSEGGEILMTQRRQIFFGHCGRVFGPISLKFGTYIDMT